MLNFIANPRARRGVIEQYSKASFVGVVCVQNVKGVARNRQPMCDAFARKTPKWNQTATVELTSPNRRLFPPVCDVELTASKLWHQLIANIEPQQQQLKTTMSEQLLLTWSSSKHHQR